MPLFTTLASLSQTAASNAADGSTDAPSTIDNQLNLLASFIAQLRDGGPPQTSVILNYSSTTSIALQGENGGYIWINGTNYSVGSGVSKTLPTLTTNTVYNVYAFWTGSAVDLEFSTTAYVQNANGIPQKSGDVTRTLVGRIRTNSTTTTYNTASDCGVVSYWNRRRKTVTTSIQSSQNTASTTDVAVLNGPTFISWGLDSTDMIGMANNGNTVNTAQNATTIYVNGALLSSSAFTSISGAGGIGSATPRVSSTVASGYATTTLYGRVNAGTGTWYTGSDLQVTFLG